MEVHMNKMPKTFTDDLENMNEDTCIDGIVSAFQNIETLEQEKKDDEHLAKAKEMVKQLSSGYSASIKLEKNKIKLLMKKLKEIQNPHEI